MDYIFVKFFDLRLDCFWFRSRTLVSRNLPVSGFVVSPTTLDDKTANGLRNLKSRIN